MTIKIAVHIGLSLMLFVTAAQAQTEAKIDFNDGIAEYQSGDYKKAQERFERAYQKDRSYTRALYNAGNSAYLQGDFDQAKTHYTDYASSLSPGQERAQAYFNLGNAHMKTAGELEKDPEKNSQSQAYYKEAVKAYKESLKNNPNDEETKYNLMYALSKLNQLQQQQEQEQEQEQNQDNDKNKDENQDQKEDQNKDNQDKNKEGDKGNEDQENKGDKNEDKSNEGEDGDKKEEEGKGEEGDQSEDEKNEEGDQQNEQPQGSEEEEKDEKEVEGQLSRAQAIKDLDAINGDERKILMKVANSRTDKKQVTSGKDW